MSFLTIQGTPAQVVLFFVNVDSPPPPFGHPLGGAAGTIIRALLLQELSQSAQDDLNQLLTTPLDQTFNQAWSQLQSVAQSSVQQAVLAAASNAYNINVTSPSQGTLSAQTGNVSPGMLDTLPPGTAATQLTLNFALPGFSVSFSETTSGIFGSWADPSYNLTFDGALQISVAVPADSNIPLGVKAFFLTTNMQASAGNFFAVLIGIEDVISEWLSNQPIGSSGSSLQDQIIGINIPALQQIFSELSSGFSLAAGFGFLQLGVQINTNPPPGTAPGNTVEFDLTHPFDPGPIVGNALPPGPSLFTPQIGTSGPEINAGGNLGVTGSYFPAAQSSQLEITWTDTTSGDVTQSEVQWGLAPNGQIPPPQPADVLIPRHGQYDNSNNFTTPNGLTPNTSYAFRVRDYDVFNQIATDWSSWIVLQTQSTDQVQLVLSYNNQALGFATLTSNGTFTTTVIVPASVPPGTYVLSAVLAGQQLAQTPITVLAANQPLPPLLQIINPNTGIAFTGSPIEVMETSTVTVHGTNFNPGTVGMFIDTAGGTSLGSATADPTGSFTTAFTWPFGVTGPHSILAHEGALQATVSVNVVDLPQ